MESSTGHTIQFAVLGHPIGHSLSPAMHNASIQSIGMDAEYSAIDVPPDALMKALKDFQERGFGGVNLTVPLKEVAFRNLDKLDESAQLLGAVNTVQFTESGMVGHNTDGYGFLKAIDEAFGQGVEGESIFVLGTGGAGRAVALVCAQEGAERIALSDIDRNRTSAVKAEILAANPNVEVIALDPSDQSDLTDLTQKADFIIQATPVGMKPDDAPLLPSAAFRAGQKVFDLIYMYPKTGLLKNADQAGATTANGLGMLLHQGARAFTIWTGREPDTDAMRNALEERVYGS